MDVDAANLILTQSPALRRAVLTARRGSKLPKRYTEKAEQCAAYLWASGWVGLQEQVVSECVSEDELVQRRTTWATKELQRKGILPAGVLSWVLAFAFRYAIQKFLEYLVRQWVTKRLKA